MYSIQAKSKFYNRKALKAFMLSGGCIFAAEGFAASLAATPGLTQLQAETGSSVQAVCGNLIGLGFGPVSNPQTASQDLYNQCSAMVQNGNQIQGSGATGNSLGLSSAQLGSALQNVATEEMGVSSRVALSSLSGQLAKLSSHMMGLHNKMGGGAGDDSFEASRFNLFVNGLGGFGDIKATSTEDGANINSGGFLVGADYRFNDNLVTGLAIGYSHVASDFINNAYTSGGSIQSDIFNISAFSTFDIDDSYVDTIFTYGRSDFDSSRSVVVLSNNSNSVGGANRTATADPVGNQYSAGVGFGHNFHFGALTVNPFVRGTYMYGQIDRYSERGAFGLNLDVQEQEFESAQTIVGGQLSYVFNQSYGVIIPQISFSWNHEYKNDARKILASYSADPAQFTLTANTAAPDRDYFLLGGGLSGVLQNGVQLYFNYQTLLGYQNVTSHGFSSGVRIEF